MSATTAASTAATVAKTDQPGPSNAARAAQRARFRERVLLDGSRLDGDVTGRILSARMVRAYDSATSVELTLDDQDFLILRSGLISRRGKVKQDQFDQAAWARFGETRMVIDGIAFRLVGVQPTYNASQRQIVLTFEDEIAVLLRKHHGPKRFRRGDWHKGADTRASVLWDLHVEAGVGARFMTPDVFAKQPVKGSSDVAQAKARKRGLANKGSLTIKGFRADATQLRFLEIGLTEADQLHAGNLPTLAMLCAAIGESSVTNVVNSLGYGGVWQGQVAVPNGTNWFASMSPDKRTQEEAHSFLAGGRGYQAGGAIKLATDQPDLTPGAIATKVEASGQPASFYDEWKVEAQKILDAWGGGGGIGPVRVVTHPFFFTVARDENFFDAAGRLAQDVRWRYWVDSNQAWFADDDWLFKSATTLTIAPDTPGIYGFSGPGADVGSPIGELQIEAHIARWIGAPAWRVEVDRMGAFNGLWLLARHDQDLLTEDSTITLHRPAPALKEPAPQTEKVVQTETTPASGSMRESLVKQARWALAHKSAYHYAQIGPPLATLRSRPVSGHRFDCSLFVTLVYKAAGAPDPNGADYKGAMFTGSLVANGTKTNDPQPGDLAFYGSGPPYDHVAMYVGNGQCIGIGQEVPGIHQHAARYRSDFAGFWTFDLGPGQ